MVNVTKKFMQQLYDDQRNYLVRVVINLADTNQTVLTLNNENIWGFSPTVEDAVSADEELQIGTAIINKFSFTINNIYGTYSAYDFKDAKVFLTVGLDVGNNTVERIKKGTFYVDTADYNDTFIALECLDGMHKLEKPYKTSAVTFPATADYVVQNICTACGVINDTPNFPNKSFIISNAPDKDTCTYREVLSWVAQICGCFARFNSEGHLELKWYDRQSLEDIMDGLDGGVFDSVSSSRYTTGDTADGGTFNPWNTGYEFDAGDFDDMIKDVHLINSAYSQSMSVDDVVVTGVRILVKTKDTDNTDVIASHVTGTEGYVIEISENPFITEANVATILSYLGTQLVGLTFRKANLSIPSDPSFEAGDVAIYFDRKGNYHPILVSRTTFITGEAQTIVSSAQTPARNSAERYSAETKNYVATQKQIRAEKSDRETMYDDLQDQMANMSGLYYTEVEDPQTHAVTVYYHDKQELEESNIQIVISDVGITVTDDGGESWYGLEVNGNMIANILSAIGVNADWINAGQLVIRDGNGNETFFADTATGIVRINANSFRLTGETIEDIAKGIMLDPNNLLLEPIELPTTLYWLYGTVTRGQTDPYGGTNAIKLQPVSGGEGFISSLSTNAPAKVAGRRYQLKVWLKSSVNADVSTGNSIKLHLSGVASDDIYPTTNWNEYSMEMLATSSSDGVATICGMSSFTAANGYDLYVYNPRVYAVETQEEAFNRLTNDGALRGIYMENGFLYINMDYLRTGTVKIGGDDNGNGEFVVYNDSGNEIARINNDGAKFCTTTGWTNEWLKINENIIKGYVGNTQYSAIDFCANFAGNTKYLTIDAVAPAKGIRINAPEIFLGASPGSIILNSKSTFNGPATFDTVPTFSHSLKLKNANQVVDTNHVLCFDTDGTTVGHTYLSNGSSKRFKIIDRKMTKDDLFEAYKVHTVLATYKPGHLMKGDELEGRKMPMLIAEELEEHIPEAVLHDKEGLPNDYKDRVIVAIHQQMLVEQQKEIKRLNKKVSDLEARLSRLEELLNVKS